MFVGPNPNHRLGLQASVSRDLVLNPSILGIPETQSRTSPAPQKETLLFGAVQYPQSRRNLHAPLRPPPLSAAPMYTKPETQPDTHPKLRS